MIASELINHMIPPLKPTEDAHKAVTWMEELRCNQIPVVDKSRFLGLITEEIILEQNDIEMKVGEFELIGKSCVVGENSHLFEILKRASEDKVEVVAVQNEEGEYLGVITVQETITFFAQSAAVQVPGAIVVISLDQFDYSLAEISRLVEENQAKILSSTVNEDPLDPGKLKLTLKINKQDINPIIATLERFGYKIIARFQENKPHENERERLEMLMRYLDI
jgi:acetoin utilization protein AcuB